MSETLRENRKAQDETSRWLMGKPQGTGEGGRMAEGVRGCCDNIATYGTE